MTADNNNKPPKPKPPPSKKQGSGDGGGNNRQRNRRAGYRGKSRNQQSQSNKASPDEIAAVAAKEEELRLQKKEEERLRLLEEEEEKKAYSLLQWRKRVVDAMDSLSGWSEDILKHEELRSRLAPSKSNDDECSVIMSPWLVEARVKHRNSKKSLKSDLKKCTAFVKKIKTLAGAANGAAKDAVCKSLVNEIQSLNLSRYVDEISLSIFEAKYKMTDVPYLCSVIVAMHERYEEFLPTLLNPVQEFLRGKNKEKIDPTEATKQRRVFLRILTELLLIGVISDTKLIFRVLSEAAGVPGKSSSDAPYQVLDATLVVSFAKAVGIEVIGRAPRSVRLSIALLEEAIVDSCANSIDNVELLNKAKYVLKTYEQTSRIRAMSLDARSTIVALYEGFFKSISQSLVDTHIKLQKLEKRCEQDKLLTGALTETREKGLNDANRLFENLLKSVEALSEILDKDAPVLEDEKEESETGTGSGLELWTKNDDTEELNWFPFDDEETWSFYCDLPDFLTTVPTVLLGFSDDQVETKKVRNSKKYGPESNTSSEDISEDQNTAISSEVEESILENEDETEIAEENEDSDIDKDTPHYKFMILLSDELPEIHSREKSDIVAEKFIVNHGSNKNSRKRLVKALFQVPRTRLDLLPYYSRVLASLDRVFDDIASQVVRDLEAQFHGCARFKKNINIEGRMKNARYIGELTKFRVAPPIIALRGLQRCLEDFSGANVDVACCILECCGRFLHRTRFTNTKLSKLMDTMMRLRKARNLDDRHQHLIDSAFYNISPPHSEDNRATRKNLPPMQAYLKYLFMEDLVPDESKVSFVAKQLLRLPWNDSSSECGPLVCKYMLKTVRKGRYKSSDAIAMVAEKLKKNKPEIPVRLVDAVFEGLQWALERPSFREQQRTISLARLLGDLFNYGILASSSLFEELYHFIDFGHEIPDSLREISKQQSKDTQLSYSISSTNILQQTIAEDEEMDDEHVIMKEENKTIAPVAVSTHAKFDPRVPCSFDGPMAVLRVKLVCTVLDRVHTTLIGGNVGNGNFTKLQRFLTHFQRYLFTKSLLPTEVEFAILDLFDSIDSFLKNSNTKKDNSKTFNLNKNCIIRYENWSDAHSAAIRAEETEAKHEERDKQRLLAQGGDVFESDDENDDDDDDSTRVSLSGSMKDLSLREDCDESISESSSESDDSDGSTSTGEEGSSDSDDSDESDDDESDNDSEEEVMDEDAQEEAYARQIEIEAFERELRALTLTGLEKGKASVRAGANAGKVSDTMVHASQFVVKKAEINDTDQDNMPSAIDGVEGMTFKVIQRGHKGRVEAKQLVIPTASNLAKQASKQDDEHAKERDMIKAKVLQYEADSQENEANGNLYLDQTRLTVIRNRPLSLEEIERNFGRDGGSDGKWGSTGARGNDRRQPSQSFERGRGRGSGRGAGGRTLRMW